MLCAEHHEHLAEHTLEHDQADGIDHACGREGGGGSSAIDVHGFEANRGRCGGTADGVCRWRQQEGRPAALGERGERGEVGAAVHPVEAHVDGHVELFVAQRLLAAQQEDRVALLPRHVEQGGPAVHHPAHHLPDGARLHRGGQFSRQRGQRVATEEVRVGLEHERRSHHTILNRSSRCTNVAIWLAATSRLAAIGNRSAWWRRDGSRPHSPASGGG